MQFQQLAEIRRLLCFAHSGTVQYQMWDHDIATKIVFQKEVIDSSSIDWMNDKYSIAKMARK